MDLEEFLEKNGKFNRFQRRVGMLLGLVAFPSCYHSLVIVFTAATPKHFCGLEGRWSNTSASWNYREDGWREINVTDNVTIRSKSCSLDVMSQGGNVTESLKCSVWDYDNTWYDHTIVNQWDLVCDREFLAATAGSLLMVGFMTGSFLFGIISDKYGRKTPFIAATFLQMVFGVATAFSPSYIVYVAFRVLDGIATIGAANSAFVLSMEIVGNSGRAILGFLPMILWGVAYSILPGIAYFIRDWWILQLVITVPALLMLSYYFFVPESPRWLLMNNKNDQAREIMKSMAKENSIFDLDMSKIDILRQENQSGTYIDLVRTPRATNNLVYIGLTFNTGNLAGNPYVNHSVSGLVEIVASLTALLMIEKFGRRVPQAAGLFFCGLSLMAMIAVPDHIGTSLVVLSMVGRYFNTAAFCMIFIHTAEAFPTVVRNQAVGGAAIAGTAGSFAAPYIAQLGSRNIVIPSVTFGSCSLFAALLMFFVMPETKGRDLPDSIEEGERLGVEHSSDQSPAKNRKQVQQLA